MNKRIKNIFILIGFLLIYLGYCVYYRTHYWNCNCGYYDYSGYSYGYDTNDSTKKLATIWYEIHSQYGSKHSNLPYFFIIDTSICKNYFYKKYIYDDDTLLNFVKQDIINIPLFGIAGINFNNSEGFIGTSFFTNTFVYNCQFNNYRCRFANMDYFKGMNFFDNLISGLVRFENCKFYEKPDFSCQNKCSDGIILFNNCIFKKGIDIKTIFLKKSESYIEGMPENHTIDSLQSVQFALSEVYEKLDFSEAYLPSISNIGFKDTKVDSIDLSHSKIENIISLRANNISPFTRGRWYENKPVFSFLLAPFFSSIVNKKIKINLTGVDISKIDMDYTLFELYFDKGANENQRNSVYQALLDKYQRNGETENYRLVDIDKRNEEGGFVNFVSRCWWNYGYDIVSTPFIRQM